MGIDIHGWIEYRVKELDDWDGEVFWYALADVGTYVDRQKWAFSLLFGTRGFLIGNPLAPNRGLPADVSWRAKDDAEEDPAFHSHTWITWKEILIADSEESTVNPVDAEYRQDASGVWTRVGFRFLEEPAADLKATERQEDDRLFKVERLRLREILRSTDFDFVFEIMEITAKRCGDEYVRLVVWFDS